MRRGANVFPSHTGRVALRETPRIATSGALMIGVNAVPPMPPRLEMENAALHVAGLELAVARELGDVAELLRDVEHALAVGVAHHRDDEAARRVDRDADVVVLLDDQALARLVERGVELGVLLQRGDAGLDHEGEHRQLEALLLRLDGLRLAEGLEVGDVRLVELGDVRNRDPVAVQVGTESFWMRESGFVSIGPNLAKSTSGQAAG